MDIGLETMLRRLAQLGPQCPFSATNHACQIKWEVFLRQEVGKFFVVQCLAGGTVYSRGRQGFSPKDFCPKKVLTEQFLSDFFFVEQLLSEKTFFTEQLLSEKNFHGAKFVRIMIF
jgi:hypothetical protein